MADNVHEVEEIPEKGMTVTTVVADGIIETAIQHTDLLGDVSEVGLIQRPLAAGNPLLQHDLIVRDVHAGVYDDLSQQTVPEAASVPEDYETSAGTLSGNEAAEAAGS